MKEVTDEHVHDSSKALSELIENIIKLDNVTAIGKLFADGTYNSTTIYSQIFAHRQWNLALY